MGNGGFRCEVTGRQDPDGRGDDKGAVGVGQRGAESLNGLPVSLSAGAVVRVVVDERDMNHAVRSGGASAQAFKIIQRTAMHLRPGGGQGSSRCVRTCET